MGKVNQAPGRIRSSNSAISQSRNSAILYRGVTHPGRTSDCPGAWSSKRRAASRPVQKCPICFSLSSRGKECPSLAYRPGTTKDNQQTNALRIRCDSIESFFVSSDKLKHIGQLRGIAQLVEQPPYKRC